MNYNLHARSVLFLSISLSLSLFYSFMLLYTFHFLCDRARVCVCVYIKFVAFEISTVRSFTHTPIYSDYFLLHILRSQPISKTYCVFAIVWYGVSICSIHVSHTLPIICVFFSSSHFNCSQHGSIRHIHF